MTYEEFKKGMADELALGRPLTLADVDQAYSLGVADGEKKERERILKEIEKMSPDLSPSVKE